MAFARGKTLGVYRSPEHKRARRALLAIFTPGDPCCLCGKPMWLDSNGSARKLHADHDPNTGGYRGLAHAKCNTRDGAKRGRARQIVTTLKW